MSRPCRFYLDLVQAWARTRLRSRSAGLFRPSGRAYPARATLMRTPSSSAADPEFTSRAHLRLPKRSTSRKRRSRQARLRFTRAAAPAAQPPSRASRASVIINRCQRRSPRPGSKRQVRPHRQRRSLQGRAPHRLQRHRRHQRHGRAARRPPQPRAARAEDPPSKSGRPPCAAHTAATRSCAFAGVTTPAINPPQAIAERSAQIVRVEQSRLESRTTIVERGIDRHRDCLRPQRRHRC